jgi:hypothetical protein
LPLNFVRLDGELAFDFTQLVFGQTESSLLIDEFDEFSINRSDLVF